MYAQIILPLCRPALAALGTLEVIWIYNDFFWPLLLIQSGDRLPVTTAINNLQGQFLEQLQPDRRRGDDHGDPDADRLPGCCSASSLPGSPSAAARVKVPVVATAVVLRTRRRTPITSSAPAFGRADRST